MEIKPEFLTPRFTVPLPYLALTPDEEKLAQNLYSIVDSLEWEANQFASCLLMFELCEAQPLPTSMKPGQYWNMMPIFSWRYIACRYGALCLRNYGKALEAIKNLLPSFPTLKPYVDAIEIRNIKKEFKRQFPNVDRLRHSVVHPELYSDPEKQSEVTGPPTSFPQMTYGALRQPGMFHGRTYFATFEGRAVTYDLTAISVATLVRLSKQVHAAFEPARQLPRRERS